MSKNNDVLCKTHPPLSSSVIYHPFPNQKTNSSHNRTITLGKLLSYQKELNLTKNKNQDKITTHPTAVSTYNSLVEN